MPFASLTTRRVEHVNWKNSGTNRRFTLNRGQSLACGLGLYMGKEYEWDLDSVKLSEKNLRAWMRASTAVQQEPERYTLNKERLSPPVGYVKKRSGNFQDAAFNVKTIQREWGESIDDPLFLVYVNRSPDNVRICPSCCLEFRSPDSCREDHVAGSLHTYCRWYSQRFIAVFATLLRFVLFNLIGEFIFSSKESYDIVRDWLNERDSRQSLLKQNQTRSCYDWYTRIWYTRIVYQHIVPVSGP
jgi:hypothetical protein